MPKEEGKNMKKEQILFYGINQNGSVDVLENINGHDKGNYHFSDMEAVEMTYPTNEWTYCKIHNFTIKFL